jgi:ABC-type transport system involved in multi-copper enzyme maturation permease subunit
MNLPAAVFVLRWLVRDTLRQARASGVFWLLLGVTLVCVVFCLTVGVTGDRPQVPLRPFEDPAFLPRSEADRLPPDKIADSGVDVPSGDLTLLFGAVRVPLARTRVEAVRFLELLLVGGIADTAGVLLALIWTAGFLPSFLDPATTSVLLAKPAPRWLLLAGKFLGVLVFVALQATLFVGLTWLALGIRTGVWESRYFIGVPLLLAHFAMFFCISTLLAVLTRSTTAGVIGTLAFWFACWGVNYARQAAATAGDPGVALETAYWLLPKPADLGVLLINALGAEGSFGQDSVLEVVRTQSGVRPDAVLLTSFLVPVVAFAAAVWRLNRNEH